jgi:hypothetical protein
MPPTSASQRSPPRVAQAEGPDLVARQARAGERVARRDAVGQRRLRVVDVESQQLAEQAVAALGVVERVVRPTRRRAAAVTEADVEVAVGAEGDHAAVVVAVEHRLAQHHEAAGRIGHVGVGRRDGEAAHDRRREREARVGHEDLPVARERRMEREAEQAQFAAEADDAHRREVEERRRQQRAVLDDADATGLLRDEEPLGVAGRRGHERRAHESARHRLQLERCLGDQGDGERHGSGGAAGDDGEDALQHGDVRGGGVRPAASGAMLPAARWPCLPVAGNRSWDRGRRAGSVSPA